jgi:hypothetical protein
MKVALHLTFSLKRKILVMGDRGRGLMVPAASSHAMRWGATPALCLDRMAQMTGTRTRQLQGPSASPVRHQAMQIYMFRSVRNSSVSAFTSDSTAANLPIAYAPWQSSMDTAFPAWGLADAVIAAIQRDGFFLVNRRAPAAPPK